MLFRYILTQLFVNASSVATLEHTTYFRSIFMNLRYQMLTACTCRMDLMSGTCSMSMHGSTYYEASDDSIDAFRYISVDYRYHRYYIYEVSSLMLILLYVIYYIVSDLSSLDIDNHTCCAQAPTHAIVLQLICRRVIMFISRFISTPSQLRRIVYDLL